MNIQVQTIAASPFKLKYGNFIGGEFREPVNGRYFENTTPVTGGKLCDIARSDEADVNLALDAAHARGVVHRDLKPDNIVLSNATPPKLFVLDFGIAKLISTANVGDATAPGTLTGQGTWLGTPGYMAPEQWSVDGAGPASDRYALGVIAFELLSGALPFSAGSVPVMMEQPFRAEVPALSARGAVGVPAAIDPVLKRALAKDPDDRWQTMRDLALELKFIAEGSSSGEAASRQRPTRTKWPSLITAALTMVAVAVGVAAVASL